MTDCERMDLYVKRMKHIAEYTAKNGMEPTTAALAGDIDMKEYHALRKELEWLEGKDLVKRGGKEDNWSWTVTDTGKGFIHAWQIDIDAAPVRRAE